MKQLREGSATRSSAKLRLANSASPAAFTSLVFDTAIEWQIAASAAEVKRFQQASLARNQRGMAGSFFGGVAIGHFQIALAQGGGGGGARLQVGIVRCEVARADRIKEAGVAEIDQLEVPRDFSALTDVAVSGNGDGSGVARIELHRAAVTEDGIALFGEIIS